MVNAIAYRGPDGADVWCDSDAGVALGHRRLSILDLSPAGAQPMASSDGEWVISYNGEVYNAETVARTMPGWSRRGTSDTEVIVESIARRGLHRTLSELNGMFAIAAWSKKERKLYLVRDRLGIKPLFYAYHGDGLHFASELKALVAAGMRLEIDPVSVTSFLRYAYVPAPYSIYSGVRKVLPGEIVCLDASGRLSSEQYWDLRDAVSSGRVGRFKGTAAEAEEALDALLKHAVAGQMISDVPIGAFLSGGIDSSVVVAMMAAANRGSVRTFSIGFPDFGYDESVPAREVARHLGTKHDELIVTAREALETIPSLAEMYDEPFADASQIPTYLLSKLSRGFVTVALSGDGGDEVFAGYNRYGLAQGLLHKLAQLPAGLRQVIGAAMNAPPTGLVDQLARIIPAAYRPVQTGDKLKKFADILSLDENGMYMRLVSQYPDPSRLTTVKREQTPRIAFGSVAGSFLDRMRLFDTLTYLPDDVLQKVDRASMAVSLEVRPPILDHRVVEFAWSLPTEYLLRDGEKKWLLRRVLDRYVPRELVDRPKMGFGVPIASWLRGPLRGWCEDLLHAADFGGGILDPHAVRELWLDHQERGRNWGYALWAIFMFEAWRRRWAATGSGLAAGQAPHLH
jgi:asparagine synthase (glutamine-hydrolysing)